MERVLSESILREYESKDGFRPIDKKVRLKSIIEMGKMVETELTGWQNFIKALFSENEKEVISLLYRMSDHCGNFTRRFIIREDGKSIILHKDGLREVISEEQLKSILKLSDEGKFFSGGSHCHLHPITLEDDIEALGYFIVDNKKTFEAEKVVRYLAPLLIKLEELRKKKEKEKYSRLLGEIIKEVEEFSGEFGCLEILPDFDS